MTRDELLRRWETLGDPAKAYRRLWESQRCDTDAVLIDMFGADPALVEDAASEFFTVFSEYEDSATMPEHGTATP